MAVDKDFWIPYTNIKKIKMLLYHGIENYIAENQKYIYRDHKSHKNFCKLSDEVRCHLKSINL